MGSVAIPSPAEICARLEGAPDHQFSLNDWAKLLERAFPRNFREPRPASFVSHVLSREAKIAVMTVRVERGECLHHPRDADLLDSAKVGQVIVNARNGRASFRGLVRG